MRMFTVKGSRDKRVFIPMGHHVARFGKKLAIQFQHPVCKKHFDENSNADFLGRVVGGGVRIAAIITFVLILMLASHSTQKFYSPLPVLLYLELALLVYCTLAAAKVSVCVQRLHEDSVELIFKNEKYANEFVELNKPHARHFSKAASLIGFKG